MVAPILRLEKGQALTYSEADNNFRRGAYQIPEWNANYQYTAGNFTSRNSNIYRSLTTNTNRDPATNAIDWALWVPPHTHDITGIAPAVIDEDDMHSNSATRVPTQQSVKAYVDNISGLGYNDSKAILAVYGALITNTSIAWSYNSGTKKITGVIPSGAITVARIAAPSPPTNGQTLVADNTQTGGLRWASTANPFVLIAEFGGLSFTTPVIAGENCVGIGTGSEIDSGNVNCLAFGTEAQILAGSGSSENSTVVGGFQSSIVNSNNSSIFGSISSAVGQENDGALIVGGSNNTTDSNITNAALLASSDSQVTADGGTVLAGRSSEAAAEDSTIIGTFGKSTVARSLSVSADCFVNGSEVPGSAQVVVIPSILTTTEDDTTTTLLVNGDQLAIDVDSVWTFSIQVSAIQVDGSSGIIGEAAAFFITGGVKNLSGTTSFLGTANITSYADSGASSWTAGVSVTGSNLQIRVTGETDKTIRWSANVITNTLSAADAL